MFATVFHLVSLHCANRDLSEMFIVTIERQQKIPLILDEEGLQLRNAVLLEPGRCSILPRFQMDWSRYQESNQTASLQVLECKRGKCSEVVIPALQT
jgi:hypothetical protein